MIHLILPARIFQNCIFYYYSANENKYSRQLQAACTAIQQHEHVELIPKLRYMNVSLRE